ncbi:GNAT family N-acetyltransferase [Mesobacillus foraminis]|uniref:Acetyltransferase (GNAT) family protein n=1 Tax=Mesobacillus foraminis TaxID=279826 RepID=A0A4R2BJC5_9BACI|nr:GNAT family N-acetyltransferase [Mesobacillus foraminis]TCN26074.1 acetyltransferase (GNAT) family protein [Mesobacillus foraminis]
MNDHSGMENKFKHTERTLRIFTYAETEAKKTNSVIYPIHLLIGTLIERTGVCRELHSKYPDLLDVLTEHSLKKQPSSEQIPGCPPFSCPLSISTKQVLDHAFQAMERYNQVYINEGLIINAIIKLPEALTTSVKDVLDMEGILGIMSVPRDMIVPLKNYSFPYMKNSKADVRKADNDLAPSLIDFVRSNFGQAWLDSINNGLRNEKNQIYIAYINGKIVGFACFDSVQNKKGVFGPMGTAKTERAKGIGTQLLHHCLHAMKETGYEYAIISEAGPLEFYEKACSALVIPTF